MRISAVLSVLVAVCTATIHADEPRVVFERARVSSGVTTVVEVARQYQVLREMPSADCIDGAFTCTSEMNFAQLYQITVRKRLETLATDGAPKVVEQMVHREMFATDLGQTAEQDLEERLQKHIRGFHPESALHPYATRITGREPLPFSRLYDESRTPTWICTVDAGGATDVSYLLPNKDGGYTIGKAPKETHEPVCSGLAMTMLSEETDVYETATGVLALEVLRITLAESWRTGTGDDRSIQPIPASLGYEKTELAPDDPGRGSGYQQVDNRPRAYSSRDGFHRVAFFDQATLQPPGPDSAAGMTHWRIERWEQEFGASPQARQVDRSDLRLTWLPMADPLDDGRETVMRRPSDGWLDQVRERMQNIAGVTYKSLFYTVLDAFVTRGAERDALVVECNDQGARYALTAFNSTGEVANGRAVCDAIDRLFPDESTSASPLR